MDRTGRSGRLSPAPERPSIARVSEEAGRQSRALPPSPLDLMDIELVQDVPGDDAPSVQPSPLARPKAGACACGAIGRTLRQAGSQHARRRSRGCPAAVSQWAALRARPALPSGPQARREPLRAPQAGAAAAQAGRCVSEAPGCACAVLAHGACHAHAGVTRLAGATHARRRARPSGCTRPLTRTSSALAPRPCDPPLTPTRPALSPLDPQPRKRR